MPSGSSPESRANLVPGAGAGSESGSVARRYTSGAWADVPDEEVRGLAKAIASQAPVRGVGDRLPVHDERAVIALAEVEVRLGRITAYLNERGFKTQDRQASALLDYELRLRRHRLECLRELGMTPRSRAALGLDLVRAHRSLEDEIAEARGAWDAVTVDGTADDAA